ncbi:SH3 domain-containing protein [Peribacillus asahii]|uniref:SH3 domain-containing protein n=1 Tax=Peribacillus asahii TaxID=228899 RepID=UPI00207A96DD|nr:SH3 domain-containing protein [Peribacillus asahii]USK59497.1 N-acetylmuramoyl-L-alanine amidase [Peribacillus asahii]
MKSKVMTILVATLVFFATFSSSSESHFVSAASKEGIVTANTLNVREKASTSSKTIGTLKKGKIVPITKQQSSWSQIKYGSKTGWISTKYINEIGYVTSTTLKLYKSNSSNSTSLATLKKGTSVQIKATKGSWLQVYVSSTKKTGWVTKKNISSTKAAATTASTTTYYVTSDTLNIRQSGTTKAKVLKTIKKGDAVTYYSKSGNWAKVKTSSGTIGWASLTYLSKTKPVVTKTYYVTANSLNVRAAGNTSTKVLTAIKKGAAVTYYSKSGDWAKIKTASGVTGWVSMKYLSTTKPKVTASAETVSNSTMRYVISETLNVRKSASASSAILETASRGDALKLKQTSGDWGQVVTSNNVTGWVSLAYVSNKKWTKGLKNKVIVLDPGHGAQDPGAIGSEHREKDLTLSTAKKVQAKLEAAGAKVVMTRTGDTYPTLSERVQISKKNNADVFISIHYNASADKTANGIDTFYWTTYMNEKELAEIVQEELIKSTGLKNRGSKTGNFQVVRTNDGASLLVELGFISNPDEEAIISTTEFQNDAATGITNGLKKYFDLF